jgi:hypothetical protein
MDPSQVARLGRSLKGALQYIMKLDNLAQREVEGGSRWFTEADDLGSVAMQIVPKEAETAAKSVLIDLRLSGLTSFRTGNLDYLRHL